MKTLADLFPKAYSFPANGTALLPMELQSQRFLTWRKKGKRDTLRKLGSVPTAISRKGIDLEGRKLLDNSVIVKTFQSFLNGFNFCGTNTQALMCIGNSVPPLFMRAIAHQIGSIMFAFPAMTNHAPITNYVQFLDEAWQQHLAPRTEHAPTVVSLFAGCGGSSLGYSMAGYRELLAVEWDDNAVETFGLNFPDVPIYHGDIAELSVEECLERTGLKVGELDILDGSPPCQGFSTAGKRVMDDPRNQLFQEYVRLLRGLKPKVFVMENVSGMVKGKMKLIFSEILRELKASGYKVSARLLNAMYFGVPQSRQRMIFIGVREDLGIEPSHPKAQSRPVPVSLCDYPDETRLEGVELERWKHIPTGGNFENLPKSLINGKAKYSNFHRKLHPSRPSYTLGKEEHFSSGRFYHWSEARRLNNTELQRIGSFPDVYVFKGDSKLIHNRIGNSVPPMFMKAIADHIWRHILQPQLAEQQ